MKKLKSVIPLELGRLGLGAFAFNNDFQAIMSIQFIQIHLCLSVLPVVHSSLDMASSKPARRMKDLFQVPDKAEITERIKTFERRNGPTILLSYHIFSSTL